MAQVVVRYWYQYQLYKYPIILLFQKTITSGQIYCCSTSTLVYRTVQIYGSKIFENRDIIPRIPYGTVHLTNCFWINRL